MYVSSARKSSPRARDSERCDGICAFIEQFYSKIVCEVYCINSLNSLAAAKIIVSKTAP